ncbi:MAG: MlaD family protein [Pseudooceanicola nanhaiensis]
MSDRPDPPDYSEPPEMDVRENRRWSPFGRVSIIWIVPVLALIVALAVAWQSFAQRGTRIEIEFTNAAGVTPGETSVRYRDVVIGHVEDVEFTPDLTKVIVSARVDRTVGPFLDSDAKFWVVRPQVSAEGVTGLSTVLSGVYITGAWDTDAGVAQTRFQGLDNPPLVDPNEQGTRIQLRTSGSKVTSSGSPIYFRGVKVGRTEEPQLDETGSAVLIDAFIEAPHDQLLSTATRFWDLSAFSVSFGTGGLRLDVGSFATLVGGGVSFNSFVSGGAPIEAGHVYDLYPGETAARDNAFSPVSTNTMSLLAVFEGGVQGLEAGSAVEYEGLKIGEVEGLSAYMVEDGDTVGVRQRVVLQIEPERLGLDPGASEDDVLDFFDTVVENGVRARLAKASLITSALIVELARVPDAAPATVDRDAEPYPELPTATSSIPNLDATLEGVMRRVNRLKIEDFIQQAIDTMASIESLARDPDTRAVPASFNSLLGDARAIVGSDAARALPQDLSEAISALRQTVDEINSSGVVAQLDETLKGAYSAADTLTSAANVVPGLVDDLEALTKKLQAVEIEAMVTSATRVLDNADAVISTEAMRALPGELSATVEQLRGIVASVNDSGLVTRIGSTVDSAGSAATSITTAAANVPELVDDLRGVAQKVQALQVEALVASVDRVLNSADTILSTEATQALPAEIDATLSALRETVEQVNRDNLVAQLTATVQAAGEAAANISEGSKDLPQVMEDIRAVAAKVDSLPIEDVVNSANKLIEDIDRVVGTEAARELPTSLNGALDQLRTILAQLNEGGAVENVNETLASVQGASRSVQEAAQNLPELTRRIDTLVGRASALVSAYGERSDFNADARSALRDIRDAARSISALARAIERHPNSLLFGR